MSEDANGVLAEDITGCFNYSFIYVHEYFLIVVSKLVSFHCT